MTPLDAISLFSAMTEFLYGYPPPPPCTPIEVLGITYASKTYLKYCAIQLHSYSFNSWSIDTL